MKSETPKRLARYAVVALAALALAQAVRVGQGMSNDVELTVRVPSGETVVTLRTDSGDFLRRTEFSESQLTLTLKLPDGSYSAIIEPTGRKPVTRHFSVAGDNQIRVEYWP